MATKFNRDSMARQYARRHLKTDPGVVEVHYLPHGAPDREIRLLEVNDLIVEQEPEAIDFGVDIDSETGHTLLVLDVTPSQWEKIKANKLSLPPGWSLKDSSQFAKQHV